MISRQRAEDVSIELIEHTACVDNDILILFIIDPVHEILEEGDMILAEALVRSHVDALKRKMPAPQAAILGCTHYPLMQAIFQDALGADVSVFSQPTLVAESLADYLERHPQMRGAGETNLFLTTGDAQRVSDRATQFLRRQITFEAA